MPEPLKNQIDAELVARFAAAAERLDPEVDRDEILACAKVLETLELKDRVNLIADALARALSGDRTKQLQTIIGLSQSGIDGMLGWPIASFIERHCVDEPQAALEAMAQVTESFTCEFAVRPFLEHHLELALRHVMVWTESPSEHPRRLASEGTRPRLPWGPRVAALTSDPTIGLAVLERLRHDRSEYVRRSVANHLNDVAKDHPELVIATTRRWSTEPETEPAMLRHALRSLVKIGHGEAMEVLGFSAEPSVTVNSFDVTPTDVRLGQSIELTVSMTSTGAETQKFVLDFVVHHVLANGQTSPKVFKWSTPTVVPGETVALRKLRKIATASTRRYYAGLHRVELQLAGAVVASASFMLAEGS